MRLNNRALLLSSSQGVCEEKEAHAAFSSLSGIADIYFHGVGGCTIAKFRKFDFHVVRQLVPDVIILELGTNDLVELSTQTVGSELKRLVRELYEIDLCSICCRRVSSP